MDVVQCAEEAVCFFYNGSVALFELPGGQKLPKAVKQRTKGDT